MWIFQVKFSKSLSTDKRDPKENTESTFFKYTFNASTASYWTRQNFSSIWHWPYFKYLHVSVLAGALMSLRWKHDTTSENWKFSFSQIDYHIFPLCSHVFIHWNQRSSGNWRTQMSNSLKTRKSKTIWIPQLNYLCTKLLVCI